MHLKLASCIMQKASQTSPFQLQTPQHHYISSWPESQWCQLLLLFVQVLLAADNTWLHFEDRVAYRDAYVLGVYCLNGKAVFIMTVQGNEVLYFLVIFLVLKAINVFKCQNIQVLLYCII